METLESDALDRLRTGRLMLYPIISKDIHCRNVGEREVLITVLIEKRKK
jgi:hypothetical protein